MTQVVVFQEILCTNNLLFKIDKILKISILSMFCNFCDFLILLRCFFFSKTFSHVSVSYSSTGWKLTISHTFVFVCFSLINFPSRFFKLIFIFKKLTSFHHGILLISYCMWNRQAIMKSHAPKTHWTGVCVCVCGTEA